MLLKKVCVPLSVIAPGGAGYQATRGVHGCNEVEVPVWFGVNRIVVQPERDPGFVDFELIHREVSAQPLAASSSRTILRTSSWVTGGSARPT